MSYRVIFHIDLNCFYVSAELLRNTALENQPVVVAGLHRRSVVCTANYEARSYGVSAAMPLHQALSLCPHLIVVQGDYNWYQQISNQFFHFLRNKFGKIEPASIDECYVDVSEEIKKYKRPLDLAWKVQKDILEKLGLPCSIGIGPNKFLAKMASDMKKPMGITVLRKHEITKKLWPLPITNMYGIGKKTQPYLIQNGILTIEDLANPKNENKICTLLGKHAIHIIENARGNDTNQLSYNQSVQSLSQSTTLDQDVVDYYEIKTILNEMARKLASRAKKEGVKGKLINVSIRYYDFTNMIRSQKIETYTNDASILYEHALYLFDQHQNGKAIRHLGIGLGSLYSNQQNIDQMTLNLEASTSHTTVDDILQVFNSRIEGKKLTTLARLDIKK